MLARKKVLLKKPEKLKMRGQLKAMAMKSSGGVKMLWVNKVFQSSIKV